MLILSLDKEPMEFVRLVISQFVADFDGIAVCPIVWRPQISDRSRE